MKKIVLSTVLAGLLITSSLNASEQKVVKEQKITTTQVESQEKVRITQNEIIEQNKLIEDYQESGEILEDLFNDFANKKGISYGKAEGQQKYFTTASSPVTAKSTDKNFAKTVTIAYERAMMDAQVKFVTDIYGTLATEKIQELFQDSSKNAQIFTDKELKEASNKGSQLDRLITKALEVSEKKLDSILMDFGIDSSELANKPVKLKKDIFRSTFKKTILTRASGSVAGLFPVQTFVVGDEGSNYSVGVITMYSDKSLQVAKDIASNSKSLISGKGRKLKDIIERDTSKFPAQFGIRLAYDLHGKPAIISYGQWAYIKKKSNKFISETLRKTAYETAEKLADAQIIEFVKGKLSATDERTLGDEVSDSVEQEASNDSMSMRTEASDIIEKINKKSKLQAKGSLNGITTFKRWKVKENGHNYVGIVRVWTYGAKEFAQNVRSGKGISKPKKQIEASKKTRVNKVVKASTNYNVNDF